MAFSAADVLSSDIDIRSGTYAERPLLSGGFFIVELPYTIFAEKSPRGAILTAWIRVSVLKSPLPSLVILLPLPRTILPSAIIGAT